MAFTVLVRTQMLSWSEHTARKITRRDGSRTCDVGNDGEAEGCCFSWACLGASHQVSTLQTDGDGISLDRGWLGVLALLHIGGQAWSKIDLQIQNWLRRSLKDHQLSWSLLCFPVVYFSFCPEHNLVEFTYTLKFPFLGFLSRFFQISVNFNFEIFVQFPKGHLFVRSKICNKREFKNNTLHFSL